MKSIICIVTRTRGEFSEEPTAVAEKAVVWALVTTTCELLCHLETILKSLSGVPIPHFLNSLNLKIT